MVVIEVDGFEQWRSHSRELLKRKISPEKVTWCQPRSQQTLLVGDSDQQLLMQPVVCENPKIPRQFLSIAQQVACYRDDTRWSLLYSIAWRLVFEDKYLLNHKVDPQVSALFTMRKSIGRDKHKMEAFVRFRQINIFDESDHDGNVEYYLSWFEPQHYILPLVTPFFVKRFYNMHWSILTPDTCAHWDTKNLTYTQGVSKPSDTVDKLEELWKVYYANIFNPARLKLKAMQSEMPKKYWKNLPEAPLIAELSRSAGKRTHIMINEQETTQNSKISQSRYVQKSQKILRNNRDIDNI